MKPHRPRATLFVAFFLLSLPAHAMTSKEAERLANNHLNRLVAQQHIGAKWRTTDLKFVQHHKITAERTFWLARYVDAEALSSHEMNLYLLFDDKGNLLEQSNKFPTEFLIQ